MKLNTMLHHIKNWWHHTTTFQRHELARRVKAARMMEAM